MSTVFVCHPFAGDSAGNAAAVRRIACRIALQGHVPIAPQIYLPQFIDEATERDLALTICLAMLALCDALQVYGEPTEGMRLEIAEARRLGIPIVDGESRGD